MSGITMYPLDLLLLLLFFFDAFVTADIAVSIILLEVFVFHPVQCPYVILALGQDFP